MPLVINIYNNDGSEGSSRQTAFDKDAATGVSIAGTLIEPTQRAARSKWQETTGPATATLKSSGPESAYSTKAKAAKSVHSNAVRSMLRSLQGVDPSSLSPAVRKLWTSAFGNTQGAKTTLAKSTAKSRPGKGRNVAFVHPEATFHGGDDSQYQYQEPAYQPQGSSYSLQGPQYQPPDYFYADQNRPLGYEYVNSNQTTIGAEPVTQADPFVNCPELWGMGLENPYGGRYASEVEPQFPGLEDTIYGDRSRYPASSYVHGGFGGMTAGHMTSVGA